VSCVVFTSSLKHVHMLSTTLCCEIYYSQSSTLCVCLSVHRDRTKYYDFLRPVIKLAVSDVWRWYVIRLSTKRRSSIFDLAPPQFPLNCFRCGVSPWRTSLKRMSSALWRHLPNAIKFDHNDWSDLLKYWRVAIAGEIYGAYRLVSFFAALSLSFPPLFHSTLPKPFPSLRELFSLRCAIHLMPWYF